MNSCINVNQLAEICVLGFLFDLTVCGVVVWPLDRIELCLATNYSASKYAFGFVASRRQRRGWKHPNFWTWAGSPSRTSKSDPASSIHCDMRMLDEQGQFRTQMMCQNALNSSQIYRII